jgi:hypothetical protein
MSEPKFTPEPWEIVNGRHLVHPRNGFLEIAVFSNDDDWEVEQGANKDLVCAAPDLYAVLESTLREYILIAGTHPDCPVYQHILDRANSALAKARGEV